MRKRNFPAVRATPFEVTNICALFTLPNVKNEHGV
jgi:hypothetical protein